MGCVAQCQRNPLYQLQRTDMLTGHDRVNTYDFRCSLLTNHAACFDDPFGACARRRAFGAPNKSLPEAIMR